MTKPYVFLSFDTEDPIHPESDDALLQLARLYHDAGLPACFFLVAEKARVLRERGRRDVLDALAGHEIDYHGNYWFEFPELAMVYGNRDSWEEAAAKARTYEVPGLCDVAEITGHFPVATTQHQNNHSPATTYALRQAGVKVWNHGLGGELPGIGWVMDMLTVPRRGCNMSSQGSWGQYQYDPDEPARLPTTMNVGEELKTFQQQFEALLEKGHSHLNILGHPTCWAIAEWWGWYEWALPFRGAGQDGRGGLYPHGRRWERGQVRAPEDREAHLQWTAEAARWLAARNDIEVTTFAQVLADHDEVPAQWLSAAQIRQVAQSICERFTQDKAFDWMEIGSTTLSTADALYLLAHQVEFMMSAGHRPAELQIRRTLGPVEVVLRPTAPLNVRRSDLLMAARQAFQYINAHGRLPHGIHAHAIDFGPGELLIALAQSLAGERMPDDLTIEPTKGLPKCAGETYFSKTSAASTNGPSNYEPTQIQLQGLQQSWSYRPAVRSS
jgi:hypothetical protein